MARALTRGAADPPETVFLAWLLSVPRDLDPAEAAGRMLVRFAGRRLTSGSAGQERLIELLNDTTRWPHDRLSWLARRKGGRQPAERKPMRRRTWR
jgi:hypothetical protein